MVIRVHNPYQTVLHDHLMYIWSEDQKFTSTQL